MSYEEIFERCKNKPIETEGGIPKLRIDNIKHSYDYKKNIILFQIRLASFVADDKGEIALFKSCVGSSEFDVKLEISPQDLYISNFTDINQKELKKLLYSYLEKEILFLYKEWLHEKAEELQKNQHMDEVLQECDFKDNLNKELNSFF